MKQKQRETRRRGKMILGTHSLNGVLLANSNFQQSPFISSPYIVRHTHTHKTVRKPHSSWTKHNKDTTGFHENPAIPNGHRSAWGAVQHTRRAKSFFLEWQSPACYDNTVKASTWDWTGCGVSVQTKGGNTPRADEVCRAPITRRGMKAHAHKLWKMRNLGVQLQVRQCSFVTFRLTKPFSLGFCQVSSRMSHFVLVCLTSYLSS